MGGMNLLSLYTRMLYNIGYRNTQGKKYMRHMSPEALERHKARSRAYYQQNKERAKVKQEEYRRAKGVKPMAEAALLRRKVKTEEELLAAKEKNRLMCKDYAAKQLGFNNHEQRVIGRAINNRAVKLLKKINRLELKALRTESLQVKTEEEKKLMKAIHRKAFKQRNWEKYREVKDGERKRRDVQKKLATPVWKDVKKIEAIRRECIRLNKTTDVVYEIDHIDPILHPLICGLHVPENLQILTQEENRLKNNYFKPYGVLGDGTKYELAIPM